MSFSPSRRNAIKAALELKLRRAKGVKLQEFLSELMTRVYSDAFQGVGTDYSRGDLKCDGLLMDPLTVFACYGPVNAGANATKAAMSTAVAKVNSVFLGALKHWPGLKGWKFVHNYVEQPPAQIVAKILELRAAHPGVKIDIFGREQFEAALFGLAVRRRNIWRRFGVALTESGPRQGLAFRRRACGAASGDVRWSVS